MKSNLSLCDVHEHDIKQSDPLNLSIQVSGGFETKWGSLSNGERTGICRVWTLRLMTLNCFLQTRFQQRCTCRCCGKIFRGRRHACLSCVTLCIRDVFYKSRSLELECKVGGNFHPRLIMIVKPIANKYHEGNMKRTLKRGLKVLEIAELEAKDV